MIILCSLHELVWSGLVCAGPVSTGQTVQTADGFSLCCTDS